MADGVGDIAGQVDPVGEAGGVQALPGQLREASASAASTASARSGRGSVTRTRSPCPANRAAHESPMVPAPITATVVGWVVLMADASFGARQRAR